MLYFLCLRSWPGLCGLSRSHCSDASFASLGYSVLFHAAYFGPGQSGRITFSKSKFLFLMLKICFELIEGNTGLKRKEKNIYKILSFYTVVMLLKSRINLPKYLFC